VGGRDVGGKGNTKRDCSRTVGSLTKNRKHGLLEETKQLACVAVGVRRRRGQRGTDRFTSYDGSFFERRRPVKDVAT